MSEGGLHTNASTVAIRRLREVAAMLAERPDGGADVGRWFAGVLSEYLADAHRGARLDEIVGLVPQPGQRAWFTVEMAERRDELLRRLSADGSSARQIAALLAQYETTGWRRDRPFAEPPAHYRGTRKELLFRVLRCHGAAPSWRTIARALACQETRPIPGTAGASISPS